MNTVVHSLMSVLITMATAAITAYHTNLYFGIIIGVVVLYGFDLDYKQRKDHNDFKD